MRSVTFRIMEVHGEFGFERHSSRDSVPMSGWLLDPFGPLSALLNEDQAKPITKPAAYHRPRPKPRNDGGMARS